MGFDHPQWEMCSTSKHGSIYQMEGDTGRAPTCQTCHMGDGNQMIKEADKLMAETITIVADLCTKGILKPAKGQPAYPDLLTFYDARTPIEQTLYVMFLEHRMRAFQVAFHMNPDYVTWYGLAELQEDLVEIKAEAAAMIREGGHKKK